MRERREKLVVVVILSLFLFGCVTAYDGKGKFHKVRSGETLVHIARIYGADPQEVAELNNIQNLSEMEVGSKLYLPSKPKRIGYKKLPFEKYLQDDSAKKSSKKAKRSKRGRVEEPASAGIEVDHSKFLWPVNGKLTSNFGIRGGRRHDGIDVGAAKGTPIKAADAGKVVFSGKMKGYGNLIILKHKDGFFTVYAHNDKNLAKKEQAVKRGQLIGKVGRTGRASGPHLHFEVRKGQTARNPLFFLPKKR